MEYNTALCDFLKLPPDPAKQLFTDVTTQIYPLRADPEKVKAFCDQYLNIGDPNHTFSPAGPWIIMQVCEYARMNFAEKGKDAFPHRWFAQHELAFGIPVRCTEKDGAFNQFGMMYPFIFVDNPLSMEGGRQVYGWPKSGIEIVNKPPEFQPNRPRNLVSAHITPLARSKAGQLRLDQPFVEIYQTRPFFSGRSGLAEAVTSIPRVIGGYLSAASIAVNSIVNFGNLVSGYKIPNTGSLLGDIDVLSADIRSLGETLQKSYGSVSSLIPMLFGLVTGLQDSSRPAARPKMTIYTMKQVRDADDTKSACYQAIVRSQMTVEDLKDGGLLFDPLSGDPTGAIAITLRSTGEYMKTLIEMMSERTSNDSKTEYYVRPLLPFWEKVDLSYGLADRQSWRTKSTSTNWRLDLEESSSGKVPAPVSGTAPPAGSEVAAPVESKRLKPLVYQKRGSGSSLAVSGKRDAPKAVLHIFMLEASPAQLKKLIDAYLNDLAKTNKEKGQPFFEFEVKDEYPYIYVTLVSYNKMTIGTDTSAFYGDNVLTFAVLVRYWQCDEKGKRNGTPEHAFIPLYTFVGTDWNFVTEYEVYGRLTFKSTLDIPEDAWVNQSAPGTEHQDVLSVSTTLFPGPLVGKDMSHDAARGAAPAKIIAISSKPIAAVTPKTYNFAAASAQDPEWGATDFLKNYGLDEYLTTPQNITSAGTSVASNVRTPNSIALKQVRNAIHGQQADYQSLVGVKRSFTLAEKFGSSSVKLRIYQRGGFPIIEDLGLIPKPGEEGYRSDIDGSSYKEFEAASISFTGDLAESQGQELWRRVAPSELWSKVI